MKISIDQSYTHCAWILWEDDEVHHFGVIKSDKEQDKFTRALYIATTIKTMCVGFNVTKLYLEGLSFGATGNVTRDLAGLLFTIINICQIDYDIIAPTSVKKKATGSGKATKQEMIDALPTDIRSRFAGSGYKKTTGLADLADAYFIKEKK